MSWQVRIPERVSKTIKCFPANDRQRVILVLRDMALDPFGGDITKISGEKNLWRRRVGSYRLFYSVNGSLKTVEIKEINRRTSSTY